MKNYNITQLNPDKAFKKHIYHRDQFAHYLRWTHVLKLAKVNMNILDWGCGSGNLLEVFYRNKFKCKKYLGLDIRKQTINMCQLKYSNINWAKFNNIDLCSSLNVGNDWDIICSFEVIEHIGKKNTDIFLKNIQKHMNKNTTLLLSTPIYNEKVGAAQNHIINNTIGEFKYEELKQYLEKYFIIKDVFGTFASQKDYKSYMNNWQLEMFKHLSKYYDVNLVSNFMAPFFPDKSRNCLWKCRLK